MMMFVMMMSMMMFVVMSMMMFVVMSMMMFVVMSMSTLVMTSMFTSMSARMMSPMFFKIAVAMTTMTVMFSEFIVVTTVVMAMESSKWSVAFVEFSQESASSKTFSEPRWSITIAFVVSSEESASLEESASSETFSETTPWPIAVEFVVAITIPKVVSITIAIAPQVLGIFITPWVEAISSTYASTPQVISVT